MQPTNELLEEVPESTRLLADRQLDWNKGSSPIPILGLYILPTVPTVETVAGT